MVITSKGYAGTVNAADAAALFPRTGSGDYGVGSFGELRATIGGGTRSIQLSAGRFWGPNVLDTSSAVETVSFPSQPTGDRWDMLVARRTWSTKVTSLEVVTGGSLKQLPARPNTTPGVVDDQPLWLARIRAGQSAIQELVDLRLVPRLGGVVAFDALVRQYANELGTTLRIGDVLWTRALDSSNNPRWASFDMSDTGWVTSGVAFTPYSRWDIQQYRLKRRGDNVEGRVMVQRQVDALGMDAAGRLDGASSILRLPAEWRPTVTDRPSMAGLESGNPLFPVLDDTGLLSVAIGLPGNPIKVGSRYVIKFDYPI